MTARPWLLVAVLWVVALLNYLDRQVIFSLFPLLQQDLGATDVQLGLTSTVFLWVYGLLSPFAGYLADRYGRARVIMISLFVWSIVTFLTGLARNMEELLIARALMGISEAFYLPAALALIVGSHPERSRSLAAGVHQSGLYTGMIVGGAWGGWMGDHYGWRPVFTLLGAAGVLYFVVVWLALRGTDSKAYDAQAPDLIGTLRRLLSTPGFVLLTIVFAAFSIQNWIVYTWLPIYLHERFNLSLASAGFSATFYIQVASFAGILIGGLMADRWSRITPRGRVLTQVVGLLIGPPFLFVAGFTASFGVLVIALISYGLGRGLYDANTMPVLSQIAEPSLRSTGYGIFNLCGCVVGGVAAAAAGSLKSAMGLSAAFQISAIIVIFAAGLLLLVPIGKSQPVETVRQ